MPKPLFFFCLFLYWSTGASAQLTADTVAFRITGGASLCKPIMPNYNSVASSGIDKTYARFSGGINVQVKIKSGLYINLGYKRRYTEYDIYTLDNSLSAMGLTAYNFKKLRTKTDGLILGLSYSCRYKKLRFSPMLQSDIFSFSSGSFVNTYPYYHPPGSDNTYNGFSFVPFYRNFRVTQEVTYSWNTSLETGFFFGYTYQQLQKQLYLPDVNHFLEYGIHISLNGKTK